MTKVGFIGAGQMGMGMLANLVRKGFDVTVFDLSDQAMAKAVELGATPAVSLQAAARAGEIVLTMLPTAEEVEQVYLGEQGVAMALRAGQVGIDMSTVDPGTAIKVGERLAERGAGFIDSPVSGGNSGAWAGTLTLMVGGDTDLLETVRPVLSAMATHIVHVGQVGTGSAAKLANNIIAASSMVATAEAFQLAVNYGVDPHVLTRILETSTGNSWVLHHMHPVPGVRPDSPSTKGYEPGFATDLMVEVLDLVRRAAFQKKIPLAVVPALLSVWQLASNNGYARRDCTSVYEFMHPPARGGTAAAG